MPAVLTVQFLFLSCRIRDIFPGQLCFQPGQQDFIKHIDPGLHRNETHRFQIAADLRAGQQQFPIFRKADIRTRNLRLFKRFAKLFQIRKPCSVSFDADARRLIHRADLMQKRVPVFIQKPCKQLLHCHLQNAVHIQIRQYACNIIQ